MDQWAEWQGIDRRCWNRNQYLSTAGRALVSPKLEKRLLILPLAWAAFGIGEVYALRYLLGDIINSAPFSPNDKPIGGSVLNVLFFNAAVLLGLIGISLYSLGLWKIDFSSRKSRADILALSVLMGSGFLLWYTPVALFSAIVALLYFLAVSLE